MTDSTWELLTDPDDPRHGTINGYINHGCRCDRCTAANTETQQDARYKRELREPPEGTHGTPGCYTNWRCRRPECRAAHTKANKERRARRKQEEAEAAAAANES